MTSDLPRVFADFNDLLSTPTRLWLDTVGAKEDLERQGVQLREGLELLLYDHDADAMGRRNDLVVEGVVSRDPATGRWMATVDPDAIRNESSDWGPSEWSRRRSDRGADDLQASSSG